MLGLKSNPNQPPAANGRKYTMGLIIMLAMMTGFGLASFNPILLKIYSDLLTGLSMIYMIYCGGNVGNKWVIGRKGGLQMGAGQQAPPTPPDNGGR